MLYDATGKRCVSYRADGSFLRNAYNTNGDLVSHYSDTDIVNENIDRKNVYCGGLVEIQPDSWDGQSAPTDSVTNLWGFPMSLSDDANQSIKSDILTEGEYGVSFIRFPMGFAYRGYRNIDAKTGLAKNIGERWNQNSELAQWFADISRKGGGLDVEYWCFAPYWLTGGAYYNPEINNEVCAGGEYDQSVPLRTIKSSDVVQYNRQIDAFTDAIVDDLEYLHTNVAPVRLFSLLAEPEGSGQIVYGHCYMDDTTYCDILTILYPKIMASEILSTWNQTDNIVRVHSAASDQTFSKPIRMDSANILWGYSHDFIRNLNGEYLDGLGADYLKSDAWDAAIAGLKKRDNIITCEYEYFGNGLSNEYRFANNVVRMIFEMSLNNARIVMPIIHVCKPTGQTSAQTNTAGYCLYAVDMDSGSITLNPWAYNSWKVINDNLPIGAVLKKGGDGGLSRAGYGIWQKGEKTVFIAANYSDTEQTLAVEFDETVSLNGKIYDIENVGVSYGAISGNNASISIPAYTALVYSN